MTIHATEKSFAAAKPVRRETGLTLLEVLVAMAVFALVMLGAASAQLTAISSTRNANMRSYAAFSTDSLAAIMRSNPAFWRMLDSNFNLKIDTTTDASTGAVIPVYSATVNLSSYDLDFTTDGCNIAVGGCLPSEMAVYDLKKWSDDWVLSVTSPVATISNIAATGETPLMRITLSWRQKQMSDTGTGTDSPGMLTNQYSTLVKL